MKPACLLTVALLLSVSLARAQDAARPAAPEGEESADTPPAADEEPMPRVATSTTASAAPRGAMDEIVLERTEITGNRELPKVLYIVPWQKSDPGALAGKPVNTLLDEVLAPLDREEFIRQVDYYSDLYDDASEE